MIARRMVSASARHVCRACSRTITRTMFTAPRTMRAVVLPEPGPATNFDYRICDTPQLSDYSGRATEAVRVRVHSCAVAFRDVIDRTGGFPFMQQPTVLGHEFAGVVESVGDDVEHLVPGDRVVSLHWAQDLGWPAPFDSKAAMDTFLGLTCNGGYAEYCVTHHSAFVKIPASCSNWTPNEAASIVSTFGTVYQGVMKTAGLARDVHGNEAERRRVVVTGAGGGVGSAASTFQRALACISALRF